jgi:maltose alpha-D-glucosyltransferase/alpha-amylase
MVTDEERDYMYRAYAGEQRARINLGIRRRLSPLLGNNRRRIELMNGLLCSLPGTPVIYYGDEIGMGDNIYLGDRNGVRTPMQWSSDRNAGFSRANPQKLYLPITIDPEYHYEAINVEAQQNNPNSLLWWMKRLIALRKRYQAFGRGTLEFLHPANRKILAFIRRFRDEQILVVANLSRFVQHVELDLASARGSVPVELFGRTVFPPIGQSLYPLSLGPHAFYWFELEPRGVPTDATAAAPKEPVLVSAPVTKLGFLHTQAREIIEPVLLEYVQGTRWVGGVQDEIKALRFADIARLPGAATPVFLSLLDADYVDGTTRKLCLATAVVTDERYQQLRERQPAPMPILRLTGNVEGLVVDALYVPECAEQLVRAIAGPPIMTSRGAELVGTLFGPIDWPSPTDGAPVHAPVVAEHTTSTAVALAERLLLRMLRHVEPGIHPQVEIGQYLTLRKGFEHVAPLAGSLEYRRRGAEPTTLAVLHRFVPNEGTAWQYTLDELSRFFERVLALPPEHREPHLPPATIAGLATGEMPPLVQEVVGGYFDSARLLAQRTAALHRALGAETLDPSFAPENMTPLSQRSLYQSMRNVQQRTLHELSVSLGKLPEETQAAARSVLDHSPEMLRRFQALVNRRLGGKRIRCHGNLGLGELLFTGKDFTIIDFEGEPDRSLGERRVKRSPLGDVATLVSSFHHAAMGALLSEGHRRGRTPGMIRPEDVGLLEQWAHLWYVWVSTVFVRTYQEHTAGSTFLPAEPNEFEAFLSDFLLERALRELAYELEERPNWAHISLRAILQLVGRPHSN